MKKSISSRVLKLTVCFVFIFMSVFINFSFVYAINTVNVSTYGAVPNDSIDDGQAIRQAIDYAATLGTGTEVVFSSGQYIVGAPPQDWQFNQDGNLEGWTMAQQVSGSVSSGSLNLTPSGTDPYIQSPAYLSFEGSRFKYIRIRMKNNTSATTAQIWWTTQQYSWHSARSITFNITANDSTYKDYVIDLSTFAAGNSYWLPNMIRQLRIHPEEGVASGSVNIDYIKLESGSGDAADVKSRYAYQYKSLNGLTFRGAGDTELFMTDPFTGIFKITDSTDVNFTGLRFDYLTPPFVQGTVTAVNSSAGTFDYVPETEPLQDNFEDNNANGWTTTAGTWSVTDDGSKVYTQTATAAEYVTYNGELGWTDYTVEAKIKMTAEGTNSSGTGIAFRYVDNNNYYWFNLNRKAGTLRLMKKVAGTWYQIGSSYALTQYLNQI